MSAAEWKILCQVCQKKKAEIFATYAKVVKLQNEVLPRMKFYFCLDCFNYKKNVKHWATDIEKIEGMDIRES